MGAGHRVATTTAGDEWETPAWWEEVGPYKNFRKFFRKFEGAAHFHLPEISGKFALILPFWGGEKKNLWEICP